MKVLIDNKLEELGKTRYWLAMVCNITYPTIKKLCDNDTKNISMKTIDKICTALKCDFDNIFKVEINNPTLRRIKEHEKYGKLLKDEE